MIASNLWSRPLIKQCWLSRTKVGLIVQGKGRRWDRKARKEGEDGKEGRKRERRRERGDRASKLRSNTRRRNAISKASPSVIEPFYSIA